MTVSHAKQRLHSKMSYCNDCFYFENIKNKLMHKAQLIKMLAMAQPVMPSLMSSKVSKLKEENVLRPPQMPTMIRLL